MTLELILKKKLKHLAENQKTKVTEMDREEKMVCVWKQFRKYKKELKAGAECCYKSFRRRLNLMGWKKDLLRLILMAVGGRSNFQKKNGELKEQMNKI
jgi:hypothetical protein